MVQVEIKINSECNGKEEISIDMDEESVDQLYGIILKNME